MTSKYKFKLLIGTVILLSCAIFCSNSLTWIILGISILLFISPYKPKPTPYIPYEDYREYLKSPQWAKRRLKRLKLDNYQCQICGIIVSETTAHCHHRTYYNLGNESEEDIVTLCRSCHMKKHEKHT